MSFFAPFPHVELGYKTSFLRCLVSKDIIFATFSHIIPFPLFSLVGHIFPLLSQLNAA